VDCPSNTFHNYTISDLEWLIYHYEVENVIPVLSQLEATLLLAQYYVDNTDSVVARYVKSFESFTGKGGIAVGCAQKAINEMKSIFWSS
jgi:hypothetical protein